MSQRIRFFKRKVFLRRKNYVKTEIFRETHTDKEDTVEVVLVSQMMNG